jgi:lipoprotein-anchoring transpeptidase ErfK/SrfK
MRIPSLAVKSLYVSFGVLVSAGTFGVTTAVAQPLSLFAAPQPIAFSSYAPEPAPLINSAPQAAPNVDDADVMSVRDPRLRRQVVSYQTRATAGTVIIDTANTYLYYVLGNGKAVRYGIGVGREGFTWSGTQTVSRKAEWPDWSPPKEMISRQPYLPRFIAGGEGNPLGARAIYLGNTMYRIHGTNAPDSIGKKVSSGCIRMLNADVIDLFSRVDVGTTVTVLPGHMREAAAVR